MYMYMHVQHFMMEEIMITRKKKSSAQVIFGRIDTFAHRHTNKHPKSLIRIHIHTQPYTPYTHSHSHALYALYDLYALYAFTFTRELHTHSHSHSHALYALYDLYALYAFTFTRIIRIIRFIRIIRIHIHT